MKSFDFNTLKKSHGKGTNKQTHRQTSLLLDQIGPVGRFGEKIVLSLVTKGGEFGNLHMFLDTELGVRQNHFPGVVSAFIKVA